MPFGPYANFDDCVAKNGDKASPEGFCNWLHEKILGVPAGGMSGKFPEAWLKAYDAALVAQKTEAEAFREAEEAVKTAGFEQTRFGWVKQYQAPDTKSVKGVKVFGAGEWTDSAGFTRDWTTEDLDKMVDAFEAGVPPIVPVKCGHTSDDFNRKIAEALGVPVDIVTGDEGQGQIKLGDMSSLQRKGDWAIASFDRIPEPIADLIDGGQYWAVSVEIEDEIGDYGPVITGVALLGAEQPAVDEATLERALVFGGSRKGARVWTFKVGEDIPVSTLRAEFEEIRGKIADIIKGKRGAPTFRALFGNLGDMFERMVAGKHTAPGDTAGIPEPVGKPGIADGDRDNAGQTGQAHTKKEGGNETMKELPKKLHAKKSDEIRGMKFKDFAAELQDETDVTVGEIVDALPEAPAMGIADIAGALGLGAEATVADILAAIEALKGGGETPPPAETEGGAMAQEMKKMSDKVAELETTVKGQHSLAAWKERTVAFKSIPGTPQEHAVALADIEAKAGKDAAETQFKALEAANNLAIEATKVVGSSRHNAPTDFDNEVTRYMSEHTDASKSQAIQAISKSHPELYFERRKDWNQ